MKALTVCVLAIILAAAGSAQAAGLYTQGHGDVRIGYQSGNFSMSYQLDYNSIVDGAEVGTFETGPVSFPHNALITYIPDLPLSRPEGAEWDFLGTTEGAPLWLIPEVEETDRPWLGFSTEDLSAGDWIGDLQLNLVGLSGPAGGHLSLFQSDPIGQPIIQFITSDGIDGSDVYHLATGTHAHANWVFTEPGVYEMLLKVSGQHATDGFKETIVPYTFGVAAVPEPGTIALGGFGALVLLLARRKKRN